MQGAGCRVQGSGLKVEGRGCRVQGSELRVQGSGFRAQGSDFRDQVSRFRVQCSGFRVHGSGFEGQCSGNCLHLADIVVHRDLLLFVAPPSRFVSLIFPMFRTLCKQVGRQTNENLITFNVMVAAPSTSSISHYFGGRPLCTPLISSQLPSQRWIGQTKFTARSCLER